VNELVCLDVPCGEAMIQRIKQAWDSGDAVFPLDQRLPQAERQRILDAIQPTVMFNGVDNVRLEGIPVEKGDAVVMATSGTTGTAKGVIHTHSSVTASAIATSERLSVNERDTWFACLPPAHIGGFSVILRSLATNTPVITAPHFSVEAFNNAADNGATLVSLVATALARVNAQRYRTIILGGSRPPADLPENCVTTYGMTETGSGVFYNRAPLTGIETDIRDGVIYLRGPMLMRGYRNAPTPIDHDGWLRTGDLGSFENGLITVFGREGDLIITGGENVWPEQVEERLRQHPQISDVCVAGVDDQEWGQIVSAWIVTTDKAELALKDIRSFVKETLPPHCAPKSVTHVAEIPRTALGKPRRSELVAEFRR
jgi:O-succinylbenzoic acid--CoA ligase